MNRIRRVGIIALSAVAAASFAACTNFFTTSLASGLARDPDKVVPKVTVDNVDELIAQSEGDPDMAAAVLEGIADAIPGKTPEEQALLRAAAVEVSSTASGVGVAVLDSSGPILDTLENGDLTDPTVKSDLIADVAGAVGGLSNLESSSAALVSALPDPADTVAFNAFVAQSTADDLAMAAIVLLSAKANASGDTEGYIGDFDSNAAGLTPEEELAVALASAAKTKDAAEGGDGTLSDLLNALNL